MVRLDAFTNCNFVLPGIHMMTIKEGGPFFRDPFHRLNHRSGRKIDISDYNPAKHADYLWYVGQTWPSKMPAGYQIEKRGRTWWRVKNRLVWSRISQLRRAIMTSAARSSGATSPRPASGCVVGTSIV